MPSLLSRRRITGNQSHVVCFRRREPEIGRGRRRGDDWQFSDSVSPCGGAACRLSRKAHNSFSGDQMSFTSCCVEWRALEHLSVPSLQDTDDREEADLSWCDRRARRHRHLEKALTQFVLFLRFGSFFGVKVPDCDGVAVRQQRDECLMLVANNNNSGWRRQC